MVWSQFWEYNVKRMKIELLNAYLMPPHPHTHRLNQKTQDKFLEVQLKIKDLVPIKM